MLGRDYSRSAPWHVVDRTAIWQQAPQPPPDARLADPAVLRARRFVILGSGAVGCRVGHPVEFDTGMHDQRWFGAKMSGEHAEASVDRIHDVLSDSWHADGDTTSDDMTSFEQVLRQSRWPVGLARGYLRGVAIFVLGRRARLFLVNYGKAARTLILLEAFTGKRRVVLLDLIRPTPSSLRSLILRLVDAPSMRRAVRQSRRSSGTGRRERTGRSPRSPIRSIWARGLSAPG